MPADPHPVWSVGDPSLAGPIGAEHGHRFFTLQGSLSRDGARYRAYVCSIAVGHAEIKVMVVKPTAAHCCFTARIHPSKGVLMHRLDDAPAFELPDTAGAFCTEASMSPAEVDDWRDCLRAIVGQDERIHDYLTRGIDPETGESCFIEP